MAGVVAGRTLSLDRDAQHFEMSSEQKRSGAQKCACGKVLRKVSAIHTVELIVQREVGTVYLYHDHIVHGHPALRQSRLYAIEEVSQFLLHIRWRLSCFWVQPNMACHIERIPNQDTIAVRHLHAALLEVRITGFDVDPLSGLRLLCHTCYDCSCEYDEQKDPFALHSSLLKMEGIGLLLSLRRVLIHSSGESSLLGPDHKKHKTERKSTRSHSKEQIFELCAAHFAGARGIFALRIAAP